MKQYITVEDVGILDESQKKSLSSLWIPVKFDVAAASICTDVTKDAYELYEFVVGDIMMTKYHQIILFDIKASGVPADAEVESTEQLKQEAVKSKGNVSISIDSTDGIFGSYFNPVNMDLSFDNLKTPFSETDNQAAAESPDDQSPTSFEASDASCDRMQEEDDFIGSIPDSFNKEDCIPLLSIGQMIDILQRSKHWKGDFYLYASTDEKGCEMGVSTFNFDNYGQDYETELCNVLWELVKTLL